jgi:hypothetical protein
VIDNIRQFDNKEGWWAVNVGLGYKGSIPLFNEHYKEAYEIKLIPRRGDPEPKSYTISCSPIRFHLALEIESLRKGFPISDNEAIAAFPNHPARSSRYYLVFANYRTPEECLAPSPWVLPRLDWLRDASDVNTQFRIELARTIWCRSEITLTPRMNFSALEGFLRDAPAAATGIKKLRLLFAYSQLDLVTIEPSNYDIDILTRRFTFFAERMRLEVLEISFQIDHHDLANLLGNSTATSTLPYKKLLDYGTLIRTRVVTKRTDLSLDISVDTRGIANPTVEGRNENRKREYAKYYPILKQLLLAETPRVAAEPVGEETVLN